MEWIVSKLPVPGGKKVKLVHFDVAGSGKPIDTVPEDLENCEGELGAVLWKEAVELFVPFIAKRLKKAKLMTSEDTDASADDIVSRRVSRCLCLGEGPGGCGLALGGTGLFKKVVISDLPSLYPLMRYNVDLNPKLESVCSAMALDWLDGKALKRQLKARKFDTIVGCEILYGNRHTWAGLKRVISHALSRTGEAFFCVELRNERKDVDDFVSLMGEEEEEGTFYKSGEWELLDEEMVVFALKRVESTL